MFRLSPSCDAPRALRGRDGPGCVSMQLSSPTSSALCLADSALCGAHRAQEVLKLLCHRRTRLHFRRTRWPVPLTTSSAPRSSRCPSFELGAELLCCIRRLSSLHSPLLGVARHCFIPRCLITMLEPVFPSLPWSGPVRFYLIRACLRTRCSALFRSLYAYVIFRSTVQRSSLTSSRPTARRWNQSQNTQKELS